MTNTTVQQRQNLPQQAERRHDRGFVIPPANISASQIEYVVEVEMPGVDTSGIEVSVEDNELSIIGRRKAETPEGELYYSEWPQADYKRVFDLGPDVDTTKINAQLDQGVLKLRLRKSERAKPSKIQISG